MKKFSLLLLVLVGWLSHPAQAQPLSLKSFSDGITNLVNLNGTLIFSAHDGPTGMELWKSDGTAAGTVLLKDINPGAASSSPAYLTVVGNTVFFAATDGSTGVELWKTDGTAAGTTLVKDIRPGGYGSSPVWLTPMNGTLFFRADNGTNGTELWKTDGTEAGTVMVRDINSGPDHSDPQYLTPINGTLFFKATTYYYGAELWKTDGTSMGTVMVKDINPGSNGSSLNYLTNANGTLYFTATLSDTGSEPWKSDGTEAGTVMVKDVNPGWPSSEPSFYTYLNGFVCFKAYENTYGTELWKTNGSPYATSLLKDVLPGASGEANGIPGFMTVVNNQIFFTANTFGKGRELWKTDNTPDGTVLVKDMNPGQESSDASNFTEFGGVLYMSARTADHGVELWKSNGTEAGTTLVADINPGAADSAPYNLTPVNGVLYFAATGPDGMKQLFRLNPCVNPPAPNLTSGGQTTVTVNQNAPAVVLSAPNCSGTLNWTGPDNTSGSGNITVPASFSGTYVYTATCNVAGCVSPASSATVIVQPIISTPDPGDTPGPVGGNFEGYLDKVECGTFRGWVWDRDKPNTALKLEFFANGQSIGTTDANIFRQDLKEAGKGNGVHAYSFPTPENLKNGQTYSISAKVYNSNYTLKWAPKDLVCTGSSPEPDPTPGPDPGDDTPGPVGGNFEGYLDKVECGTIRGWVWDKDKPTTALKLEFFANGQSIGTADANIFRQDLKEAGKGNGVHAYSFPTPASLKNGQTYSISAKVYNSNYTLKWAPKTLSCPGSSRMATESAEAQKPLEVVVRGNPIPQDELEVEVRGAEGQPLHLLLTDGQGRIVAERHLNQPTNRELLRFSVSGTAPGMLFLRVANFRQAQTIKLLKVK
ncbi:ELWxxDGT repeat protein [Larkinella bovis]|uniref:ELWxxDGT repeat protein n=1 Tax=Larkinella bovis TaxID=683041 RepID=A0ABW0IF70_9BACT